MRSGILGKDLFLAQQRRTEQCDEDAHGEDLQERHAKADHGVLVLLAKCGHFFLGGLDLFRCRTTRLQFLYMVTGVFLHKVAAHRIVIDLPAYRIHQRSNKRDEDTNFEGRSKRYFSFTLLVAKGLYAKEHHR